MALHWQIVALYLYFEIGFCFLLTLPFISNKRFVYSALRYIYKLKKRPIKIFCAVKFQ